ncbi:hypothetical protein B0H34DRAFT_858908 [Crassisporium funariophilum]|nr:hypothetical protein B0H34DRAFT_858908 [Crassisporium funariophilum]
MAQPPHNTTQEALASVWPEYLALKASTVPVGLPTTKQTTSDLVSQPTTEQPTSDLVGQPTTQQPTSELVETTNVVVLADPPASSVLPTISSAPFPAAQPVPATLASDLETKSDVSIPQLPTCSAEDPALPSNLNSASTSSLSEAASTDSAKGVSSPPLPTDLSAAAGLSNQWEHDVKPLTSLLHGSAKLPTAQAQPLAEPLTAQAEPSGDVEMGGPVTPLGASAELPDLQSTITSKPKDKGKRKASQSMEEPLLQKMLNKAFMANDQSGTLQPGRPVAKKAKKNISKPGPAEDTYEATFILHSIHGSYQI